LGLGLNFGFSFWVGRGGDPWNGFFQTGAEPTVDYLAKVAEILFS